MASDTQAAYWAMLRGAREGYSGQRMLAALQAGGLGMRRQQFYRLWAQAQVATREVGEEPLRPLDQAPTLEEMAPIAAGPRANPGVIQTVTLIYKERVTGKLRTVYHNTVSDAGVTRQQAIDNAADAYASHSQEYQTTLVAAAHTSTRRIVPMGLAA